MLSLPDSMFDQRHPWCYTYIDGFTDGQLFDIYGRIDLEIRSGIRDLYPSNSGQKRWTLDRIRSTLQRRGVSTMNLSSGFTLGSVGTLRVRSPGFVIGQRVQDHVISLPAPQPHITFQTVAAPQPNISVQTIPAPQPAALPPAPEGPKLVHVINGAGILVGKHYETEQQKFDREYEEWKVKNGAK